VTSAPNSRIVACPACGKPTAYSAANRWRPFCSERCRQRDLGAWASETYRVPAVPGEEDVPGTGAEDAEG
jgi:endogenous inhibitor of DNA gyrase (YacG/DUF329 family)